MSRRLRQFAKVARQMGQAKITPTNKTEQRVQSFCIPQHFPIPKNMSAVKATRILNRLPAGMCQPKKVGSP